MNVKLENLDHAQINKRMRYLK